MNNNIPTIIAKTITLTIALGLMFFFVLDAHEEQKELNISNDPTKSESRGSKIFFHSSKIVVKSVVTNSTIGMKIDANRSAVMHSSIGMKTDTNKTEDENISR